MNEDVEMGVTKTGYTLVPAVSVYQCTFESRKVYKFRELQFQTIFMM